MDYLYAQGGETARKEETHDSAWLRKLSLNFEKIVNKNELLRAKCEGDSTKLMESTTEFSVLMSRYVSSRTSLHEIGPSSVGQDHNQYIS